MKDLQVYLRSQFENLLKKDAGCSLFIDKLENLLKLILENP